MVNKAFGSFSSTYTLYTKPHYISNKPSYFQNYLLHLGLASPIFFKNYDIVKARFFGYEDNLDWTLLTNQT